MGRVALALDALAPEPKTVRLAGRTWLLPADIPLSTVVRITRFAAAGEAEVDDTRLPGELVDLLLELFRVHQPDLETLPALTLKQALTLLDELYQLGLQVEEQDAGEGKAAGGTRNTPRRAATRAS